MTRNENDLILDANGVTIIIPDGNTFPEFIRDSILSGTYEDDEIDMVDLFFSGNERVLELGCAIGVLGTFTKKLFPNVQWYSVDGNPHMCVEADRLHQENQVILPYPLNVIVNHEDEELSRTFYIREEFLSSSLSSVELPYSKIVESVEITTYNINELISNSCADTLVVDIEGGEAVIFTDKLDLDPINKIIIEYHPGVIGQDAVNSIDSFIKNNKFENKSYRIKEFCSVAYYERAK